MITTDVGETHIITGCPEHRAITCRYGYFRAREIPVPESTGCPVGVLSSLREVAYLSSTVTSLQLPQT